MCMHTPSRVGCVGGLGFVEQAALARVTSGGHGHGHGHGQDVKSRWKQRNAFRQRELANSILLPACGEVRGGISGISHKQKSN